MNKKQTALWLQIFFFNGVSTEPISTESPTHKVLTFPWTVFGGKITSMELNLEPVPCGENALSLSKGSWSLGKVLKNEPSVALLDLFTYSHSALILTLDIPQVGTNTHMVTMEMTATPSARLAPGNPTDPRLQQAT